MENNGKFIWMAYMLSSDTYIYILANLANRIPRVFKTGKVPIFVLERVDTGQGNNIFFKVRKKLGILFWVREDWSNLTRLI